MKKVLYLIASVAFVLVGCAREAVPVAQENGLVKATFNVALEDFAGKTVSDGNAASVNRCVMEIFYGDPVKSYGRYVVKVTDKAATFSNIEVVANRNYQVAFWADHVADSGTDVGLAEDLYYNTASLQAVSFIGTYAGNLDERDAFFSAESWTPTASNPNKSTTLHRPFAQVNVITTDWQKVKHDDLAPTTVTLTIQKPYTQINLLTGALSGNDADLNYSASVYESPEYTSAQATLSMDYLLASSEKSVIDIDWAASQGSTGAVAHSFTAIPYQRNFRTNIKGALLTLKGQWTIEVDPEWGSPDHEKLVVATTVLDIDGMNTFIDAHDNADQIDVTFSQQPNDAGNPSTDPGAHAIVTSGLKEDSNLNVNVASDTKTLYIGDFPDQGTVGSVIPSEHATVNINVPSGMKIETLVINAPYKSVYLNGTQVASSGTLTNVEATTAESTLIVAPHQIVGTLTVHEGGLEIHGTVNSLVISETDHDNNPVKVRSCENLSAEVFAVIKGSGHNYIDTPKYVERQNLDGSWNIVLQDPVAKIGDVLFYSVADAVNAAQEAQTIQVVGPNHEPETVTLSKSLSFIGNKDLTWTDVKFTTSGTEPEFLFKDMNFAGNSYINLQGGKKMTMTGCYADVSPDKVVGRSAFIVLGTSEVSAPALAGLDLDITQNTIIVSKGSNAKGDAYATTMMGWRYIKNVNVSGNTFFSETKPTNWIALKFMNAVEGAVVKIKNNTVYANRDLYCFNGFDLYQNNSRANFYTVFSENNDMIVAGTSANTQTAFVVEGNTAFASKTNVRLLEGGSMLNGTAVDFAGIDVETYGSASEGFLAVKLQFDANGKVFAGNFNRNLSTAEKTEYLATGYTVKDSGEGYWNVEPVEYHTVLLKGDTMFGQYETIAEAVAAFNYSPDITSGDYTLNIAPGIYNEDMILFIQDNTPEKYRTLLVQCADENSKVTVKSTSGKGAVFGIAAESSYSGGPISFKNINFDVSENTNTQTYVIYLAGSQSGNPDLIFPEPSVVYNRRYGHDITFDNCDITGNGTSQAVFGSTGAGAITMKNSSITNCAFGFNGYFVLNPGNTAFGLHLKNVNFDGGTLINDQSAGNSEIAVEDCQSVKCSSDYAIRTSGSGLILENCDYQYVIKNTNIIVDGAVLDKDAGVIYFRSSETHALIQNCTITKQNITANGHNLYDIYNKNTTVTVNGKNLPSGEGKGIGWLSE